MVLWHTTCLYKCITPQTHTHTYTHTHTDIYYTTCRLVIDNFGKSANSWNSFKYHIVHIHAMTKTKIHVAMGNHLMKQNHTKQNVWAVIMEINPTQSDIKIIN